MSESGSDSMSVLAVLISVVLFALIYILFGHGVNAIIDFLNSYVDSGVLTETTFRYFNHALNLWKSSPFFMLIGLVLFVLERSKGTDISYQTYYSYLMLMVGTILLSLVTVFVLGITVDSIFGALYNTSVIMDVHENWDNSSLVSFLIKLGYYGCLAPGYIGSILYIFHPVIRQLGIVQMYGSDTYEAEDAGIDINLKQF